MRTVACARSYGDFSTSTIGNNEIIINLSIDIDYRSIN